MKIQISRKHGETAKVGKIALLWLLGIPLPIAILVIIMGGCR